MLTSTPSFPGIDQNSLDSLNVEGKENLLSLSTREKRDEMGQVAVGSKIFGVSTLC